MALWGSGLYGQNLYSADTAGPVDLAGNLAPGITLRADLSIVGKVDFVGNLAPSVTFSGNLSVLIASFAGNLAPQVTFGPSALPLTMPLAGDLSPQVNLAGSMSVISAFQSQGLQGGFYFYVNFSAVMMSGPLWAPTAPCDPVEWEEAELCHG